MTASQQNLYGNSRLVTYVYKDANGHTHTASGYNLTSAPPDAVSVSSRTVSYDGKQCDSVVDGTGFNPEDHADSWSADAAAQSRFGGS